jgi:hypothetical protein
MCTQGKPRKQKESSNSLTRTSFEYGKCSLSMTRPMKGTLISMIFINYLKNDQIPSLHLSSNDSMISLTNESQIKSDLMSSLSLYVLSICSHEMRWSCMYSRCLTKTEMSSFPKRISSDIFKSKGIRNIFSQVTL